MAVFPDRIVLKNSTDDEASIVAAIEVGGSNEITQGEAVLGLSEGEAAIYTKDALGNIVTINGNAPTLDRIGDVMYPLVPPGWDNEDGLFFNCDTVSRGTYNAVEWTSGDLVNLYKTDKDNNDLTDWLDTWLISDNYSVFIDEVQVGSSSSLVSLDNEIDSSCRLTVEFVDNAIFTAILNAPAGSLLQVQNNTRPFTVTGEPGDGSILVYDRSIGMWVTAPNTGGGSGTGGLVFWGGGDFTTGLSDGEAPDGGEFTV